MTDCCEHINELPGSTNLGNFLTSLTSQEGSYSVELRVIGN